ncbi:MAG: hypothetical protein ACREAU_00380 [Nitrosopumilaceae archaeon]
MGIFDAPLDTPEQIVKEGDQIQLVFEKTGPTTAKVTWNIPSPIQGCSDITGTYNGIVLTLDTIHEAVENKPHNRQVYLADPTADVNLHVGDKLGTALVIGALYDDRTTTTLNISGIKANTPYYINGYAVDKQYRYHFRGAHAYSLDLTQHSTPNTPSTQLIQLGPDSPQSLIFSVFNGDLEQRITKEGVLGTDGTGLVPGQLYSFDVQVGRKEDGCVEQTFTILIDGSDAQTFNDLVNALNKQFALMENPPQTPIMPNTGAYYWDAANQKLFQWDGDSHVELPVLLEPEDPANILLGTYWHNTITDELFRFNLPAPSGWNLTPYVDSLQDPTNLNCDAYWFNGTMTFVWNGSTWCQLNTFNQITDPCSLTNFPCGTYWYDTDDAKLFVWDTELRKWNSTVAIFWPDDPNNLPPNTFWFDDTNDKLFRRTLPTWTEEFVIIDETDPAVLAAPFAFWFNPATEELKQRNVTDTAWIDLTVLVWPEDPTDRESCDLWWESDTDKLFAWDINNNEWDEVVDFIQTPIDPSLCPPLTLNDVWFNPDTGILSRWDGLKWNVVSFINFPTDPTIVVIDSVWFDGLKWFSWNGSMWIEFNPIDSSTDPTAIPNGTYWFDIDDNILFQRAGLTWIVLPFSTMPLTPTNGTVWFDSSNMVLNEWNGTQWVPKPLLITASLTQEGHLLLTTRQVGSLALVRILTSSINPNTGAVITLDTLFTPATALAALVSLTMLGTDGISPVPSYLEIGVGDDGSSDERKDLIQQIRRELGYPVIQVELTIEQLNHSVDNALLSLRKRCSTAYNRGFFFLDILPGVQTYILTNKLAGYNKITNVMELYRLTSAFLSSAHGAGVYGQIILQHLYNMGTFDLLSFDLVGQYVNQLEISFAARLTFLWDETERKLQILNRFAFRERIMVDAMIERTEQELMTDRYLSNWLQKMSRAQAMQILAQIRGKYGTLPGAGGGISLNAAELQAEADAEIEQLLMQIDDFVIDRPEEVGMGSTLVFG